MNQIYPHRPPSRPSSPSKSLHKGESSTLKRRRSQLYGLILVACSLALYLLYARRSDEHELARKLAPRAVIVTLLDKEKYSAEYQQKIIANRKSYAEKWGYSVFTGEIEEYQEGTGSTAKTFAKLPLIRHALATYPYTENFWYLTPNALILNDDLDLEAHVLEKKRLNSIMLRDQSIIPPKSIIKTFKNLQAPDVQFILTQDTKEVSTDSFIIRRINKELPSRKRSEKGVSDAGKNEFATFLLDTWFDPLYRSYSRFPKGDRDALQHIVQWHPTILQKLALIPQRAINSYPLNEKTTSDGNKPLSGTGYQDGDLVVTFDGCDVPETDCKEVFERFWTKAAKEALPS